MNFILAVILIIPVGIFGQLGIKTRPGHFQAMSQINQYNQTELLYNNNYSSHGQGHLLYQNSYDENYPPMRPLNQQVIHIDKTVKFLNDTRSKMATGVCYMEVKTASLVNDKTQIPVGNGSDPTMSKIRVCCDGYERNVHNFLQCDPICKNSCINGICVAPDVCVCYPDHIRNYAGYCLPTCPIGCGNGACQEDGSCLCKPGYSLDVSKKFCAAVCIKGCHNGNCTAPEVCECSKGFELNEDGVCEPKCDNCENGRCVEPGVCTCLRGYIRKNDKCEPVCMTECKNGFCSAPEICGCNPGWTLDATGKNCVPHCDHPCLNGFCNGNNVCSCHNGYIQDEVNPNLCKPHCPQGCPNGYCTSPNLCLCKPGFVKTGIKGRQQCTPV